jgi:hypothetical protein
MTHPRTNDVLQDEINLYLDCLETHELCAVIEDDPDKNPDLCKVNLYRGYTPQPDQKPYTSHVCDRYYLYGNVHKVDDYDPLDRLLLAIRASDPQNLVSI